jgi:hypothetical protein
MVTKNNKHGRAMQDRRTREKNFSTKALKEANSSMFTATDKIFNSFSKELRNWVSSFREKIKIGKNLFISCDEVLFPKFLI